MCKPIAAALVALLLGACAGTHSQEEVAAMLKGAMAAADARVTGGDLPEAAILIRTVSSVDPHYPGVSDLEAKVGPQIAELDSRNWLGINRRLRVYEGANFLWRLFMYVPDRALDLLDLVTFEVHVGLGVYANVHATRAVQVGAGLRTKIGAGAHDQRSIGLANEAEIGVAAAALGTQSFSGAAVGVPGGLAVGADSMAGMHWPSDELYQTYRDYWAIGASVTAGLVGAEFDVHPMQLFDFVGGIFFLDFARDDLSTTRRLRFNDVEFQLIHSLSEVRRDRLWRGGDPGVPD
jgi:hypothetical protein